MVLEFAVQGNKRPGGNSEIGRSMEPLLKHSYGVSFDRSFVVLFSPSQLPDCLEKDMTSVTSSYEYAIIYDDVISVGDGFFSIADVMVNDFFIKKDDHI